MSVVGMAAAPAMGLDTGSVPILPEVKDPIGERVISRKRRMNFFDMANLLDSDGNLQNEMLVFAFAATMLSTIPILLGNEFDVNVGLRKRRQAGPYRDPDGPETSSYVSYTPSVEDYKPAFFSGYTYKQIMTSPPGMQFLHIHNGSTTGNHADSSTHSGQENAAAADATMAELLQELLKWSQEKVKNKPLLPMLINLILDRYHGNPNPADKFVKVAYKNWKNWY
ncbi:uncharacterized protein [Panulirus ornatus]|uniref:uncharacterized protein n=1 Tax=Panulirus ornatus TaxID=150431 RepID=UPI003A8A223B